MSSPSDQANLAPVDVREHTGWLKLIFAVFQQKHTSTINDVRGENIYGMLTCGRVEEDQRGSSQNKIAGTRQRGSMTDVPTPQALIRQVTGLGDTVQGR